MTVTKPFLVDIECMIWPPQIGPAGHKGSVSAEGGQEEVSTPMNEPTEKARLNSAKTCAGSAPGVAAAATLRSCVVGVTTHESPTPAQSKDQPNLTTRKRRQLMREAVMQAHMRRKARTDEDKEEDEERQRSFDQEERVCCDECCHAERRWPFAAVAIRKL